MLSPQAKSLSIKLTGVNWIVKTPQSPLTLIISLGGQVRSMPLPVIFSEAQLCSSVSETLDEHLFELESSDPLLLIRLYLPDDTLFFSDTLDFQLIDYGAEVMLIVRNQNLLFGWMLMQLSRLDKASEMYPEE